MWTINKGERGDEGKEGEGKGEEREKAKVLP